MYKLVIMAWKSTDLGRDIPTQSEIINIARKIESDRDRTLFILCYLTAGRISEVLELKTDQLEMEERMGREVVTIYHMPNKKNKRRNM